LENSLKINPGNPGFSLTYHEIDKLSNFSGISGHSIKGSEKVDTYYCCCGGKEIGALCW